MANVSVGWQSKSWAALSFLSNISSPATATATHLPHPPGSEPVSMVVYKGYIAAEHSGRLTGSFGRLKVQRIRRSSWLKKETNKHDDYDNVDRDNAPFDGTSNSSLSHKKIGDAIPITGTKKHTGNTDLTPRPTIYKRSEKLTKSGFSRDNIEVPTATGATSLRGWDDGKSVRKFRNDSFSDAMLKREPKLSSANGFFSRKSFRDLECCDDVVESLKAQRILHPSHIQAQAFAPVLEGKSCIIADQSGSGKTLAYLAPVIQRLKKEELQGLSKSQSKSPRVIILVPTAELASQVLGTCRSMSKFGVPFRSMVVTGGFRQRTQLENLQQDLDVLIATPGRFMILIKEGFLQLTNLRCAVLDEVDVLFNDKDFEFALQCLIKSAPMTTQYLFVTATLQVDIYNKLVESFPDTEPIMGPGMHRTSPGLEEVLVDCSGDDGTERNPDTAFLNKKEALLQLVEESSVSKTIVFCNKIETCRKVENVLKRVDRKGVHLGVLAFHSALAQESRLANMKEFLKSGAEGEGSSLFLICTDRASRGIDFEGVDHVVLFDFPRDPSEYIRRVGRTARGAGGKGTAFIFVVGKQVSLARRILDRNQKGRPLHDVPFPF